MLRKWLFRRRRRADAGALYEAIVAQARQPAFYARLDVPDTVMGRFQLIALHVILVVDRLLAERRQPQEARELAQALQEAMFDATDAALREMGVSDLGVPRRMQKLAELFFGLMKHVRNALDGNETALQAVLARNIYAQTDDASAAADLARYAVQARRALATRTLPQIANGALAWPAVAEASMGERS